MASRRKLRKPLGPRTIELRFATVRKLTLLALGCAVGFSLAPAAGASPGDMAPTRLVNILDAPFPQQPGSSCDANYSGACVPIDSDVDCAGGSGNGPSYVAGPVTVVGTDIYGLDRDGNGVGCE